MFGYVRPLKAELLMREYARYRSVYCGICRQIRCDYGQLPRLATSYDLTLLALLLLSVSNEQPPVDQAACLLNPFLKKPMVRGGPVLAQCAALAVILAYHKAIDSQRDRKWLRGALARLVFWRAWRRACRRYPEIGHCVRTGLEQLSAIEKGPPDRAAAVVFGRMLQDLFLQGTAGIPLDEPVRQAIGLLGGDLGRWIYLLDAIDDWADDCNNGNWNPYGDLPRAEAAEQAARELTALEEAMDRTAALLPYIRDSGLMANIFTLGLPEVRRLVIAGGRPGRM